MSILVAVGAFGASLTSPALTSPDLTSLAQFDDQCQPSPAFDQMLGSLLSIGTNGTVRKGKLVVPDGLRSAFGRMRLSRPRGNSDIWFVSVAVTAKWRGLRLRSIDQYVVPNTGVGGFTMRFAEPLERVRDELRQVGYQLAPGRVVDVAKDGMSIYASLASEHSGSVFSCGT